MPTSTSEAPSNTPKRLATTAMSLTWSHALLASQFRANHRRARQRLPSLQVSARRPRRPRQTKRQRRLLPPSDFRNRVELRAKKLTRRLTFRGRSRHRRQSNPIRTHRRRQRQATPLRRNLPSDRYRQPSCHPMLTPLRCQSRRSSSSATLGTPASTVSHRSGPPSQAFGPDQIDGAEDNAGTAQSKLTPINAASSPSRIRRGSQWWRCLVSTPVATGLRDRGQHERDVRSLWQGHRPERPQDVDHWSNRPDAVRSESLNQTSPRNPAGGTDATDSGIRIAGHLPDARRQLFVIDLQTAATRCVSRCREPMPVHPHRLQSCLGFVLPPSVLVRS